jgi:hypothetical protein|tara:strand:- start:1339 stop:2706 length:1368 start_codon:yes stop_codon:yes gene_type:complete
MAEQTPTFASETVEPTELERITNRLNTFTVGLKPANAEQVNQIMQKGLQAGNFKLDELDALVQIREQINTGIIDYNTQVQVATKRIQELEIEEAQRQKDLVASTLAERDLLIDAERRSKKLAEQELRVAEEENKILKAQLEALSNVQNNVTSKPIQDLLDESRASAEMAASPKTKSKAWEMVRQARPDDITEDEDLAEKLDETKKAFKDFESETQVVSTPALQDNVQFRPHGITTESFYDEVEKVNEVAEADELFAKEEETVGFDDESFDEDADFVDDEMFYNGVSPEEALEDVEDSEPVPSTGQVTSKPVISGGNAPNIQAQVSEPENIVAPVEEEKKTIPTFDTEEELLASVNAKVNIIEDEAEEEYEEITIPSRSELENSSKAEVQEEGDKLGFELSGTKEEMIDQFEEQTESFIASLQEDGDFISASETDNTRSDEEKKDGDDDVRDGGYF